MWFGKLRASTLARVEDTHKVEDTAQEMHRKSLRVAWNFAIGTVIHENRQLRRNQQRAKYGHYKMSTWGRISKVFEKFFWFNSHLFVQYFLQAALFSAAIWYALLVQNVESYIFTRENYEHRPVQFITLCLSIFTVSILGLFILVPSILMRYTMVCHLAQLQSPSLVRKAVEEARALEARGATPAMYPKAHARAAEAVERPWSRAWLNRLINSRGATNLFLMLILVDFLVVVCSLVFERDSYVQGISDCYWYTEFYLDVGNSSAPVCNSSAFIASNTKWPNYWWRMSVTLDWVDLGFAYVFVCEVFVRFMSSPPQFLNSAVDMVDAAVVVVYAAVQQLLASGAFQNNSFGFITLLRVVRLLRFQASE